jgi:flagellar biosynthesis protein FliR
MLRLDASVLHLQRPIFEITIQQDGAVEFLALLFRIGRFFIVLPLFGELIITQQLRTLLSFAEPEVSYPAHEIPPLEPIHIVSIISI